MKSIRLNCRMSIQDILDSNETILESPEKVVLEFESGIYRQRIHMKGQNVNIRGIGTVIIRNFLGANALGKNKTFQTATFICEGKNVCIENIIFANDGPQKNAVGQAIALYINGDRISINNCKCFGNQDTVCIGPVVKKNKDGSKPDLPIKSNKYENMRYLFKNCDIKGSIDYVFGGGSALFENCKFLNVSSVMSNENYLCAPCTDKNKKYGFVFYKCRIISQNNIKKFFLARPWRKYAKAYFIDCQVDKSLDVRLWSEWGKNGKQDFRYFYSDTPEKKRKLGKILYYFNDL